MEIKIIVIVKANPVKAFDVECQNGSHIYPLDSLV